MTPEARARKWAHSIGIVDLGSAEGIKIITAALAEEREESAMHVFTHPMAEFAGDTIPAQITHRTGLANSIRYRDRKDGTE